jgi:hypothetical protein
MLESLNNNNRILQNGRSHLIHSHINQGTKSEQESQRYAQTKLRTYALKTAKKTLQTVVFFQIDRPLVENITNMPQPIIGTSTALKSIHPGDIPYSELSDFDKAQIYGIKENLADQIKFAIDYSKNNDHNKNTLEIRKIFRRYAKGLSNMQNPTFDKIYGKNRRTADRLFN